MTLNTFHSAGVGASSVVTTTGVPRMKEIVNVAKTIKTPSLTVYLREKYANDMEKAKQIKSQLEFTKMEEIVQKTQIIYDSSEGEVSNNEDIEFIKTYQDFAQLIGYQQCTEEKLSKWVLRIEFNKEDMMNRNIFLSDIQEIIMKNSSAEDNIQCVFSDDNAGNLIMRIRVADDHADEDYLGFLQDLEKTLMSITIRGIPNIDKAQVTLKKKLSYTSNGGYQLSDEWFLGTEGVNLIDALLNEYVDETRTTSNDINEILEIFGIEAARNCIINEFNKIIEEFGINYRHIAILSDLMTYRGTIMPIERHGINRSADAGPIAKSTFEESTEILVKASTFAQNDKMSGVSSNIMMGQFPKVGTNSFDVMFDETKFLHLLKEKNTKNVKEVVKEEVTLDEVEDEIQSKFKDNLFGSVEDSFGFQLDITKNPETNINTHVMQDVGIKVKGDENVKKNRKVKLKIKK
jgi:DNA-directed RNA polymerase II subunit RPB1